MTSSKKIAAAVFVISGLLLFGFALFLIGDRRQLFSDSIELWAEFKEVSGLQSGAPVRVSGMNAGEVLEINVPASPEQRFRIKFRVLEKFRPILRQDSVVTIQTEGLVGNKFLQVDAGTEESPRAEDGDTVQSREPFDFADMLQQLRDTVDLVNSSVGDVKQEVDETIGTIADTAKSADELITGVSGDVEGITASGERIANNIDALIAGVRAGRGTVGQLFTNDQIYRHVEGAAGNIEQTTTHVKETSGDVQAMVAEVRQRKIIENLEQTAKNIREATERAKKALADLQPDDGEGSSVATDLRQTIANANEAMSDISENTEALKHNWFFRGFFKDRRFYDLDTISVADYKAGRKAPGWPVERVWLPAYNLFSAGSDGSEKLTDQGKKAIDAVMGRFVDDMKSRPIIVEGYAADGSPSDRYVRSHQRAVEVRRYIVQEYSMKPDYVGVIEMGAVESAESDTGYWEGVALVQFSPEPPDKK